jgi:hypothetical protein
MPTFSSLMRMRCTLPSQGDVFRSVSRQFPAQPDKELSRSCAASGPLSGHLSRTLAMG